MENVRQGNEFAEDLDSSSNSSPSSSSDEEEKEEEEKQFEKKPHWLDDDIEEGEAQ
jgi:hypothetical protein